MFTSPIALTLLCAPTVHAIRARPRLFGLLDAARTMPIIWIGGGPGAGKTTLLASYLQERRLAGRWYHVESGPSTPVSLSHGGTGVDTGPAERVWQEPAQSGAEGPAGGVGVDRRALRELWCRPQQPGMVLFEDCHDIPPDSPFHALLAATTREVPAGVNIVLIGRGEPPAVYARLIANGTMAVVAGSELAFSPAEACALVGEVVTDHAAAQMLQRRCAGWAAGLTLAVDALRRHPTDSEQADHELRRGVSSYFAAEVFDRATSQERQILVSTALLPRVCSRMAQALSGTAQAWCVLNRLARRQLFIVRSAGAAGTCEYAPLFREFLLTRIEDSLPPGELSALADRASELLQQSPAAPWLEDCELLRAYAALRRGERAACHELLCDALTTAQYSPSASQACLVFPAPVGELCHEALDAGIAVESARRLIQRYRLPPPVTAGRQWPWPISVQVLGSFRLLKEGAPLRFSRRAQRKPLELLQALIAFGGTEVGAGALIDALWPDSEGDAGYHALESALYRLRRLLGSPEAVRMVGCKLSLDRRQFWVDMWELERELDIGERTQGHLGAHLTRARQLYVGHFLQHETEKAWALKTRQALRDRFLRHLRNAARAFESRRVWHEAVRLYQTGLELEPLGEELYRGLMVCYRELGDHTEALQAYRRCRELLTRLLGVPPNAKTEALYHSVRQSAVAQPR